MVLPHRVATSLPMATSRLFTNGDLFLDLAVPPRKGGASLRKGDANLNGCAAEKGDTDLIILQNTPHMPPIHWHSAGWYEDTN